MVPKQNQDAQASFFSPQFLLRLNPRSAMSLESQLFDAFRIDRQDRPIEGYSLECLPHLRRHMPLSDATTEQGLDEALLCFSRLEAGREDEQIKEQIEFFRRTGRPFEWKVYAPEQPADLKDRLERHGFVADEGECFMLYSLSGAPQRVAKHSPGLTGELALRRITDAAQLDDVLWLQAQVWGRDFEWLREKLATTLLEPGSISMFCAYVDGSPVGAGWTNFPAGSRFPELHGGSVLAAWRGQGIYSALFDVRFAEARERGFEWIAVDASPMSRPILEAMGFMPICSTWPMRYRFAAAST